MKTRLLTLLLALASCTSALKDTHIMVFKDEGLSSPNQPVFRFAVTPAEGWQYYSLVTRNSSGVEIDWGTVYADNFGNIVTWNLSGAEGSMVPFTLALPDYGPGEPLDVWLFQGEASTHAHIVPHPIQVQQYGYSVYLEKVDALASQWRVLGDGFFPGEIVGIITTSGSRLYTTYQIASETGAINYNFEAPQEGRLSGKTRIEFHASQGALQLDFPFDCPSKDSWFAWRQAFVAEKQKQDKQFRHDLKWTTDYRGF